MTKAEFWRPWALLTFLCALAAAPALAAVDVALVTAIDGGVSRLAEPAPQPVQNFVKLKEGDVLSLDKGARLQIVYFDGGRQETWNGAGKLEVARAESKPTGLAAPQLKQLPAIMVRQIARTPALDVHGRGGATRLRAIVTPEKIAGIEKAYARLKSEAAPDDLNPEFYRLSAFFEVRDLERVEAILAELQQQRGADAQVRMLVSVYQRALKDARPVPPAPAN
jgi:hypothetical protein